MYMCTMRTRPCRLDVVADLIEAAYYNKIGDRRLATPQRLDVAYLIKEVVNRQVLPKGAAFKWIQQVCEVGGDVRHVQ